MGVGSSGAVVSCLGGDGGRTPPTSLFILYLGITIRLDLINGSDETAHREPLQLNRCRPIADGVLR